MYIKTLVNWQTPVFGGVSGDGWGAAGAEVTDRCLKLLSIAYPTEFSLKKGGGRGSHAASKREDAAGGTGGEGEEEEEEILSPFLTPKHKLAARVDKRLSGADAA